MSETSAPSRVLIVHNAYQLRGGEDAVADAEATLLRRHGHRVEIYSRDNREIDETSGASLALQTLWSSRTRNEVDRILGDFRPDVVHVHNTFPLVSPSVYWAARRRRVAVVQTLHNFRLLCPQAMLLRDDRVCEDCIGHLPWRGVVHRCYRGSAAQTAVVATTIGLHRALGTYRAVTRYVALSEFSRRKLIDGGLPGDRILVKPNFVDLPAPRSGPREGFLFVGRLSREKGLHVLVEALAAIGDAKVTVIGDGPERSALASERGLRLLGSQDSAEVYDFMRASQCLILPAISYENFPVVVVEAFACGVPVIASRLGSIPELVDDGRTGLLFEAGSPADLAAKILWARENPLAIGRMGNAARAEYEVRYTPERNYRQLTSIYRRAIADVRRDL